MNELLAQFGPEMITPPEPRYIQEPRGRYQGHALAVARPRTVQEVSDLVRACAVQDIPIVPYSGGTGLVGGQTYDRDTRLPLLLSLERMRAIRAIHAAENVMIAEAGAILANVQEAAAKEGRLFPLSMASEGSAAVGGFLATNAGGVNVIRYGNARDLCLGIEAVLPNGEIFHGLKRLRKDNTGYDLRHLLIGAEGSLGIITAAALKLVPRPQSYMAAMFVVPSPQAAVSLLTRAKSHFAESLSAFELIAQQSFDFLARAFPDMRQPFERAPQWAVLMDLGMAQAHGTDAALEAFFTESYEAGDVLDGVLATSEAQRHAFWALREHIPLANRHIGSVSNHDISLPISMVPDFIDKMPAQIAKVGAFRINCFGHLGDGNLHYNIFPIDGNTRADHDHQRADLKRLIHDNVHDMGGSVSAEHGIGRLKVDDLERYGDPAKLAAMRAIKTALDPQNIMNPGAVLRAL